MQKIELGASHKDFTLLIQDHNNQNNNRKKNNNNDNKKFNLTQKNHDTSPNHIRNPFYL